jgi:hypothetical protein
VQKLIPKIKENARHELSVHLGFLSGDNFQCVAQRDRATAELNGLIGLRKQRSEFGAANMAGVVRAEH